MCDDCYKLAHLNITTIQATTQTLENAQIVVQQRTVTDVLIAIIWWCRGMFTPLVFFSYSNTESFCIAAATKTTKQHMSDTKKWLTLTQIGLVVGLGGVVYYGHKVYQNQKRKRVLLNAFDYGVRAAFEKQAMREGW